MIVGLVACCARKACSKTLAKDMYQSALFNYSMKYLKRRCDKIFILSAKYGLLDLDEQIMPYNQTLNTLSKEKRIIWSEKVLAKLRIRTDLQTDHFIILAGKKYREEVVKQIKSFEVPMQNLGIGKQLSFLKEETK